MNKQIKEFLANNYKHGNIVAGKVIKIEADRYWIDVGLNKLVDIPKEFISSSECDRMIIGETKEFLISQCVSRDDNHQLFLDLELLKRSRIEARINQLLEEDVTIYAEVIDRNNFGILVIIEGFLGFVPHFHLESKIASIDLIETRIPLKIISFIHHGNFFRLIFLSHIYALNKNNSELQDKPWDVVDGKVIKIENDGAWIDIGVEQLVYISIEELIYISARQLNYISLEERANTLVKNFASVQEILQIGQKYQFVIRYDCDKEYNINLSLSLAKIHSRIIWKRLKQLKQEQVLISARVIEVNSHGSIIVDVEGIRGFISSVEISDFHLKLPREKLIGKELPLEILKVDDWRKSLTLSYSMPIKRRRIKQLKIGQIIEGKICAIKPYGVFVDIQDIRAFLDKSEVSESPIDKLDRIFKINDKIQAIIIDIDMKRYRVLLSTKGL